MAFHQRTSPRRKTYDYASPGGYFIAIVTKNREHYFGDIVNGKMILNNVGVIVDNNIADITKHFDHVKVHEFVVMPNHIHLLLLLNKIPDRRDVIQRRDVIRRRDAIKAHPNMIDHRNRTAQDAVPTPLR